MIIIFSFILYIFFKVNYRFAAFMLARGVKVSGARGGVYRFAVHNDINRADIDTIAGHMLEFIKSIA